MRKATDQRDALFMLTTQGCGLMPDIKSRQQFQITGQYAQLPNVIYKAWDSSMQQAVTLCCKVLLRTEICATLYCAAKYYSGTTLYYKVLLRYYKVLLEYYKVLLQY